MVGKKALIPSSLNTSFKTGNKARLRVQNHQDGMKRALPSNGTLNPPSRKFSSRHRFNKYLGPRRNRKKVMMILMISSMTVALQRAILLSLLQSSKLSSLLKRKQAQATKSVTLWWLVAVRYQVAWLSIGLPRGAVPSCGVRSATIGSLGLTTMSSGRARSTTSLCATTTPTRKSSEQALRKQRGMLLTRASASGLHSMKILKWNS